jgi:hypothetical protein
MRLKWLRDGVEDYDYIQILKNLGKEDQALQIARSVGPDWTNWTRDPNEIEAARLKLGETISQLMSGVSSAQSGADTNGTQAAGSPTTSSGN